MKTGPSPFARSLSRVRTETPRCAATSWVESFRASPGRRDRHRCLACSYGTRPTRRLISRRGRRSNGISRFPRKDAQANEEGRARESEVAELPRRLPLVFSGKERAAGESHSPQFISNGALPARLGRYDAQPRPEGLCPEGFLTALSNTLWIYLGSDARLGPSERRY